MTTKERIFQLKTEQQKLGYAKIAKLLGVHLNTVRFHLTPAFKRGTFKPSRYHLEESLTKAEVVKLMGGKCQVCGYDKCLGALEFHHKDEKGKKFALSKAFVLRYSKEKILKELDKCDLLCCRCHREIHCA
jgi:hypothetical protein